LVVYTVGGLWVLPPGWLILAHGGIPGMIAETGLVFIGLGLFGYFLHRPAKKEREDESTRP